MLRRPGSGRAKLGWPGLAVGLTALVVLLVRALPGFPAGAGDRNYQPPPRPDGKEGITGDQTAPAPTPAIDPARDYMDRIQREGKALAAALEWKAGLFRIVYQGYQRADLAHQVLTILRQAYLDIGQAIGAYPDSPLTVIIYTEKQFMEITEAQDWAGGSFDLLDGKIRIPGADIEKGGPQLKAILYHEYSHAALHHLSKVPVPIWFDEGMAQYFEGRYASLQLTPDLIAFGKTIVGDPHLSFLRLEQDRAHSAYKVALSLFAFLNTKFARSRSLPGLIKLLSQETPFPEALEKTYGITLEKFLQAWEKAWSPE